MPLVKAIFDSIDLAELASLRLKSELKTVRHVDFASEPYPQATSAVKEAFGQTAANTRFADYYNYPVSYNENSPTDMSNAQYGYYEPDARTVTRVTVSLSESEVKPCMSLLRSIGGTKVSLQSE